MKDDRNITHTTCYKCPNCGCKVIQYDFDKVFCPNCLNLYTKQEVKQLNQKHDFDFNQEEFEFDFEYNPHSEQNDW